MMIPTNIPWGLIAGAIGVIALVVIGWVARGSREEKRKLKAKLELKERIDKARGKVIVLDRKGRKSLERIRNAKKGGRISFADFANKLLREIFPPGKR